MILPDALPLANGFLLGQDDEFSKEFAALVKQTGVTHLVAASGANLAFLEKIFTPCLRFFSIKVKKIVLIQMSLGYFVLVGSSGSLWRALIMWILPWMAWWLGRKVSPMLLLFQVVVVTVLFRVEFLASASFWLSWLAMCGLLFSRLGAFREKNFQYFSLPQKLINSFKNVFLVGWFVFFAVTIWLWTQYQVFQPHGIVVTWGIHPLVPAYMITALHWRVARWLCSWWPSGVCATWEVWSVQAVQLLYWPIEQWLLLWEWWLQSSLRWMITNSCIFGGGVWVVGQSVRRWRQRSEWNTMGGP